MLYRNCVSKRQVCLALVKCGATKSYSTEPPKMTSAEIRSVKDTDIRKSVFISQSYDIFTNLALEDWIYRNYDFTNHHVLMLWANDPCVVVGRHQNPFAETNVSNLKRSGIVLARRNSGGGTVYHDRGNLNCSFFTPRERYDRKYNLNLVTRALYREWGISAEMNERDDITLSGKKISGTAAKLGKNAYHHCTLLVNSNKQNLSQSLAKDETEVITKATASVRSPIKNITDVNRHCNVPQLLSAIGYEFLRTPATELADGGREQVMKQRGFQLLNPTEKWFPGLSAIRDNYASWDWRFGRTPKFSVQKTVQLKSDDAKYLELKLNVTVEKGLITDINLLVPNGEPIPIVSALRGQEYMEDSFGGIVDALKQASTENVKQAMGSGL